MSKDEKTYQINNNMYAAICPVLTNIARWIYLLAQPEESQKIKFIFARF